MNRVQRAHALALILGLALMASSYLPQYFHPSGDITVPVSGNERELGTVEEICEALRTPEGALRIRLSIVPYGLRNYQNVFQTSDFNNGLRLEIDESGVTSLILGQLNSSLIVGNVLQTRIVPLKETTIEIEVSQKYGLSMKIPQEKFPVTRTTYGDLVPACDKVQVGVGYDETRKFLGTVKIQLEYGSWRQLLPLPSWSKHLGFMMIFVALLSWAVGDTYRFKDTNDDCSHFKEPDVPL